MLHDFMKRRKWRLHHLICGRCARLIFVIIPRLMQIERCACLAGCNFGAVPARLHRAAARPARRADGRTSADGRPAAPPIWTENDDRLGRWWRWRRSGRPARHRGAAN